MKEYEIQQKEPKKEFSSRIRVINNKYGSLGVTIPKEIVELIDLKKGDLLMYNLDIKDNKVNMEMSFKKQD